MRYELETHQSSAAALFEPDTVLPAQFYQRARLPRGLAALYVALIDGAVLDLKTAVRGRKRHDGDQAAAWFELGDIGTITFADACDVLGLDWRKAGACVLAAYRRGDLDGIGQWRRNYVGVGSRIMPHRDRRRCPERFKAVSRG